eukprot:scaffold70_cov242-Pinguiococcus_pyrenoidosus.AAC.10
MIPTAPPPRRAPRLLRLVPSYPAALEGASADEESPVWYPHRLGNMVLLAGKRRSAFPAQCFVGPNYCCMSLTFALLIVPNFFFLRNVALPVHLAALVLGSISALLVLGAFTFVACSDPGVVFKHPHAKDEDLLREGYVMCDICQLPRPKGAQHCYDCNVCVEDLDHHCPWTGKCIGKRTIVLFRVFLGLLAAHLLFVIILTLVQTFRGKSLL